MIWNQLRLKRHVRWSLVPRVLEFNIVLHQQVNHDQLDLIARKKSAGTCVPAVPKCHAFQVAGCPLDTPFNHWITRFLAYLSKPKGIKLRWIWEDLWIHGNGLGGDPD